MAYTELPNSSFMDHTSWRSGASGPTGGGDHDFNALIVQLDFTSSAGHGWLMS